MMANTMEMTTEAITEMCQGADIWSIRVRAFGCLLGGMLVLQAPAHADPQKINARALGILESVRHYCAPIDPASVAKLDEKIKALENGVSEKTLAGVRASPDYLKAHSSMDEFVSKVDDRNAKKMCAEDVRVDN